MLNPAPFDWSIALAALLASLAINLLLVWTQRFHGHLSMDTQFGIQKFHIHPTPRIGGVGIFLGVVCAYMLTPKGYFHGMFYTLIGAGVPAFVFGLSEDITKRISVRARLLATMFCGILGWMFTGYAITDVNIPGIDYLLGFTVMSVAFTAFAVGGVANAINIIDGFNGLAAGSVAIMFFGLGAISHSAGDVLLVYMCVILCCSTLGFLLVNWPRGKIFLGDGGSYFLGFSLAWISVLLLARNPEVSAWAPLLVCAYPILEVLFSVLRRRRRGMSLSDPDRLHLHSLVMRRVVRHVVPAASSMQRNSLTGGVMWIANILPVAIAVAWQQDTHVLVPGLFICVFFYLAVYARITQFTWCFSAVTLRRNSKDRNTAHLNSRP